jgi:hypothetical protein
MPTGLGSNSNFPCFFLASAVRERERERERAGYGRYLYRVLIFADQYRLYGPFTAQLLLLLLLLVLLLLLLHLCAISDSVHMCMTPRAHAHRDVLTWNPAMLFVSGNARGVRVKWKHGARSSIKCRNTSRTVEFFLSSEATKSVKHF